MRFTERIWRPSAPGALLILTVFSGTLAWCLQWVDYRNSPMVPGHNAIVLNAIATIQSEGLKGRRSDWDKIQTQALTLANISGREADLDKALAYIVDSLDDGHSFYIPRRVADGWVSPSSSIDPISIAKSLSPVDGVPRIQVHSFAAIDRAVSNPAAIHLRHLVDTLVHEPGCGLIVDLRGNSGGNLQPMALGLLPLFAEGVPLQFEDVRGSRTPVVFKGGAIVSGLSDSPLALDVPWLPWSPNRRIAVVIGGDTGSSGEFIALLFKGQSNARLFGEPTAGAITGNRGFALAHGGWLALASSWAFDRTGQRVESSIVPDAWVSRMQWGPSVNQQAARWVNENCAAPMGSHSKRGG